MKKSFVCKVLAVAALFAACVPAFAGKYDSWPEKDVHIIYYTRPCSGGDTFLRNLAVAVKGKLNGHSIVIENIIDPSGAVPWGRVQRANKDGYTLACLSTTVVTADLIGHSPVKYPDFAYICALGNDPQYIFCRKEMPFNTLPELLAYAKANPGKLNWGTAAPTSASTPSMGFPGHSFRTPTAFFSPMHFSTPSRVSPSSASSSSSAATTPRWESSSTL